MGDLVGPTPRFAFSPVDSLESSLSLVSGVVNMPDEVANKEKGTTEKRFRDGSVEVLYSNGNRLVHYDM